MFLFYQSYLCTLLQIRKNKLIYQDKPRLRTALELLRASLSVETILHEVNWTQT